MFKSQLKELVPCFYSMKCEEVFLFSEKHFGGNNFKKFPPKSYLLLQKWKTGSAVISYISSVNKLVDLHRVSCMLELVIVIFLTSLHMTSLSDLELV